MYTYSIYTPATSWLDASVCVCDIITYSLVTQTKPFLVIYRRAHSHVTVTQYTDTRAKPDSQFAFWLQGLSAVKYDFYLVHLVCVCVDITTDSFSTYI